MSTLLPALVLTPLLLGANPYLKDARRLYEDLRFKQAETKLLLAKDVKASTSEEHREVHDLLVLCLMAQGKTADAERVYADLLSSQPAAPPPEDAPPNIQDVFHRAKARVYPASHVVVRASAAPQGRLQIELVDPWAKVAQVALHEARAFGPFVVRKLSVEPLILVQPQRAVPPDRYFVEALAADGSVLAQAGSAAQPLAWARTPAGEPSLASAPPRWPIWARWAALSAAVIAVGAGTTLAVGSARDSQAAGAQTFADDTLRLDLDARRKALHSNLLISGGLLAGAGSAILFFRF